MLQYGNIETVMGNIFVAYRHDGISVLAALAEGDFIAYLRSFYRLPPAASSCPLPPKIGAHAAFGTFLNSL